MLSPAGPSGERAGAGHEGLAPESPEPAPRLRAGAEGFSIESADGAFVLKLDGYVQADARLFVDAGDAGPPHTFLIRRARPIVAGTLFKYFDFRLMPDFGSGTTSLQDGYIDAKIAREFVLRAGKFKAPFGLERLASATSLWFVERGFPTALLPNRDIGVEFYGDAWDRALSYAAGVFDGVADGGSTDGDTDRDKELVARIFAHPLRPLGLPALKDLGLGVAVSFGRARGTLDAPGVPTYKTSGQQTFFRYLSGATADLTVLGHGERLRVSPQAYYFAGPLALMGEYVVATQQVLFGTSSARLTHRAGQAAALLVLGGTPSYQGVRPAHGLGAFELAARYHALRIDRDAFPTFADPSKSARDARGFTLGVGYWPSSSARLMLDFDRTSFAGGAASGADRRAENVVLVRTQLGW